MLVGQLNDCTIIKLLLKLLDIQRFMVHGSRWTLGTHEVESQYIILREEGSQGHNPILFLFYYLSPISNTYNAHY